MQWPQVGGTVYVWDLSSNALGIELLSSAEASLRLVFWRVFSVALAFLKQVYAY